MEVQVAGGRASKLFALYREGGQVVVVVMVVVVADVVEIAVG